MSASDRMRAKLSAISKQHEDVNLQKKKLEEETRRMKQLQRIGTATPRERDAPAMNAAHADEGDDTASAQTSSPAVSVKKSYSVQTRPAMSTTAENADNQTGRVDAAIAPSLTAVKSVPDIGGYMSQSAVRVSDWILKESLEDLMSQPPVIKSTEVYETVRTLGRGAFGDVNLVKSVDDNRLYADKTIYAQEERYYIETLREVRFLRRYGVHPFIIDIFDCYAIAQPRVLHIIMPYCEAGDIGKVIAKHKKSKSVIAEPMLIKWILQIGLALQFLHKHGVVHRDLKPENVMLVEGGEIVKLCDFGLALVCGKADDKDAFAEAGTPNYTAPELMLRKRFSFSADCWSFGVMMYEMMCLFLPFVGSTTTALVKAVLTEPPRAMPAELTYSDNIRSIVYALLNKDPLERLDTVTLLTCSCMSAKLSNIPQGFRPKTLEERSRRQFVKQLTTQVDELKQNPSCAAGLAAPSTSESGQSTIKFKLGDVEGMARKAAVSALINLDSTTAGGGAGSGSGNLLTTLAENVDRSQHTKVERVLRQSVESGLLSEVPKDLAIGSGSADGSTLKKQASAPKLAAADVVVDVKIPSPSKEMQARTGTPESGTAGSTMSNTPIGTARAAPMSDSVPNSEANTPASAAPTTLPLELPATLNASPLQGRGGTKGLVLNEAIMVGRMQVDQPV